jgi:predicted AAA+ superfamily ATPase
VRLGGLPGLAKLPDDARTAHEYFDGVLPTIVLRDIVMTHAARDPDALERIARYLAANAGNQVTAASIPATAQREPAPLRLSGEPTGRGAVEPTRLGRCVRRSAPWHD